MVLNAKKIRLAIKHNVGIEGMAEENQCSVEELERKINNLYKNFPDKSQSIIAALYENQKKIEKYKAKVRQRKGYDCSDGTLERLISIENTTEESYLEVTDEALPTKTDRIAALNEEGEKLKQSIAALQEYLQNLEKQRSQEFDMRRAISAKIEAYRQELLTMKEQINNSIAKVAELDEAIAKTKAEIPSKNEELAGLLQEIEELSTVTILVSDDGTIEAPEDPDFVIDDEGWEPLVDQILKHEACRPLFVYELDILARLLQVIKHSERSFTLGCDSDRVQKAFWKIWNPPTL